MPGEVVRFSRRRLFSLLPAPIIVRAVMPISAIVVGQRLHPYPWYRATLEVVNESTGAVVGSVSQPVQRCTLDDSGGIVLHLVFDERPEPIEVRQVTGRLRLIEEGAFLPWDEPTRKDGFYGRVVEGNAALNFSHAICREKAIPWTGR